ncbi:MAG: gliding motility-associated C-terminal domain-containing protein [Reichenbachiella sp.]
MESQNWNIRFFLLIVIGISSISQWSFAQTKGFIYEPAQGAGAVILDPNSDAFVSSDNNGFVSNDEAESEISYIALPTAYGETDGDASQGGTCSHTDLVKTGDTQPLYFYSDGTDNLYVRFRLGGASNSTKTYSVFVDTDEAFGYSGENADPNAVTGNPGFEVEIAYHTNGGIGIYDIDGTVTPIEVDAPYKTNRPEEIHSQKSVAFTEVCSDIDYFYDFYVSFADLAAVGITNATAIRMVGASGISANSLMGSNSITDIAGIDDATGGDFDLMEDLVSVFPPVTGSDLSTGDPILLRAACPGIDAPVPIEATDITGTSTEPDGTTIEVFEDGVSLGSTSVNSGTWTYDLMGYALTGGFEITATAFLDGVTTVSANDCNPVLVEQICSEKPVVTGTTSGTRGLFGTSSEVSGSTITIWEDFNLSSAWSAGTNFPNPGSVDGSGDWTIAKDNGGGKIDDGVYYLTAQNSFESECQSEATIYCVGLVEGLTPAISTTPILESTTSLSGTNAGISADVNLYINDIAVGANTTSDASGNWTLSISGHNVGDVIEVKATETGFCTVSSEQVNVQEYSIPALILGEYCAGPAGVTEISGISSEPFGSTVTLYTGVSSPVTKISPVTTTTVDADGTWVVDLSATPLGSATYVAVSNTNTLTTPNELESDLSNEIFVLAQTDDGSLSISTPVITEGDASISGNGTTGNTVQLYIDGLKIDGFSDVVAGGTWTISGLDDASAGFDVLYPAGQVSVTSIEPGKCESDPIDALDVTQCRAYSESSITLSGSSTACVNEAISVSFVGSENLVIYQLYTDAIATLPTGLSVLGNGGDIEITTAPLSVDITKLYLKASRIGVDCDHIFSTDFNISIKDVPAITLVSNSINICDDATSGAIEYTGVTNGPLLFYDIDFNADAEAQGFVDINDAAVSSHLTFDVPIAAMDGTYGGTVNVANTSSGTCMSANYNFTFKIIEDIIAYGATVDPSCLNNDGSIEITGLKVGKTYQLDYDKDSNPISLASISSDGSGSYLLDNISGGDYLNFEITESGCTSNILSATQTLAPPADPILNITSTNITQGDESISGTGTNGVVVQLYIDDVAIAGFSNTIEDGEWVISGLDAASAGSDILYPGGLVSVKTSLGEGCTEIVDVADAVVACKPYQNNTISLIGNADVCINETLSVSFAFSESNVTYQLYTDAAGANPTGTPQLGDGSDIILTTDPLSSSVTQIYLRGSRAGSCSYVFSTTYSISVKGIPSIVLTENDFTLCSDVSEIVMDYTDVVNGPLLNYDINFNAAAELAGFVDVVDATIASQISVPISVNAPRGSYAGVLSVANSSNSACQTNYNFTFELIEDIIAYGNVLDPTCLDTDGSIEITGLQNDRIYQLNYEKEGAPIAVNNVTSDVDGNYLLENISSGSYANFSVAESGCNSNILTGTQILTAPSAPSINISTRDIKEGDASISGTGTNGSLVELYIDNVKMDGISTSVSGGNWTISGLDAASAGTDLLTPGGSLTVSATLGNDCEVAVVAANALIGCKPFQLNTISFLNDAALCVGEHMNVTFSNSETGVSYQLYTDALASVATGLPVVGDGNDITLISDPLTTSINSIYLKASRNDVGCTHVFSNNLDVVVKARPALVLTNTEYTVCVDQPSVVISFTDLANGPLVNYNMDFDGVAESQNFVDVNAASVAGQITIDIPNTVESGLYSASLVVSNNANGSCTSTINTFSFNVVRDEIAYGNVYDIGTCDGIDGGIEITGLRENQVYQMQYYFNGSQESITPVVANQEGIFLVNNLSKGDYKDFVVQIAGCESNTLGATQTLFDPEAPIISLFNQSQPTNCLGYNGFIALDGMDTETVYELSYFKDDQFRSRSILTDNNGQFALDSLNNGVYTDLMVERLECTSNVISDEVVFACAEALYNTPVVTPNGDGVNDYMEIEGIEDYPNNKVSIFNRWGSLVWDIQGYQNDNSGFGGQGNARGSGFLTDGTYFIVIDLGDGSARQNSFIVIKR